MVDLRNRVAFASSHLQGSVSFEYGRGSSFTAYVGWVLPWNRQLTLVGARDDVEKAIRDLSRIGIDSPMRRSELSRRHSRRAPPSCIIRAWAGTGCCTVAAPVTWCWMCGGRTSTAPATWPGR